ncbi:unnamed protein product [Linum trigynum]|uniref:Uncharacterized protein n=1 Tax=Linum trigynum TaxID=586398 RepID=A0AAV2E8P2_9ROSI
MEEDRGSMLPKPNIVKQSTRKMKRAYPAREVSLEQQLDMEEPAAYFNVDIGALLSSPFSHQIEDDPLIQHGLNSEDTILEIGEDNPFPESGGNQFELKSRKTSQ